MDFKKILKYGSVIIITILLAFAVLGINSLWPGISFSADLSGFWERMAEQLTPEQIEAQKIQMENLLRTL